MKRMKQMIAMCLAVLMVITICPQQVEAASYKVQYNKLETLTCYSAATWYNVIWTNGKAKITKVKIGKKSLANVSITADKQGITVNPKKAGTTTLKITVKNGSKTKTHSIKLKIYKYENPLSSFKISSKQYKNDFKTSTFSHTTKPKKTKNVKLNVKAKKGYEITSIRYTYYKADGTTVTKTLKNGKNFKLYNKKGYVTVGYKNKSTGYVTSLLLQFF